MEAAALEAEAREANRVADLWQKYNGEFLGAATLRALAALLRNEADKAASREINS